MTLHYRQMGHSLRGMQKVFLTKSIISMQSVDKYRQVLNTPHE